MENEINELERPEKVLATRYKMAHAWGIDSVEVFNEVKARAFSEKRKQAKEELIQMSKLYDLRRQCVSSHRNRR